MTRARPCLRDRAETTLGPGIGGSRPLSQPSPNLERPSARAGAPKICGSQVGVPVHLRRRIMTELTKPYEPNAVLRALYARWFDHIRVDKAWAENVREMAIDRTVIYVLRNLSFVDYLALDHVTKRYQLPRIRFANDMGVWLFDPFNPGGRPLTNVFFGQRPVASSNELRDALNHFGSAALFLKRPPRVLDVAAGVSAGRGSKAGDELVRTLFAIQRSQQRPIVLLPLLFVWTQQPDTHGRRALDVLLGPPEWPNTARTVVQFLLNYRRVALKSGEPLNLRDFLQANDDLPDEVHQFQRTGFIVIISHVMFGFWDNAT